MDVLKELLKYQDLKYKEFIRNLTPTLPDSAFIGVRNPQTKAVAKELFKSDDYESFLYALPHEYYEENNVHAYLLCLLKDYDKTLECINAFLPYVNNWSTCDIMRPKAFEKNKDKLVKEIKRWIKSKHTYTVRFGIEMLMNFYLDDDFKTEYLDLVSTVRSEEYYIKMMVAWYFATALSKHYDETLPILLDKRLDKWCHNKTIQKAIESYRISDSQKEYLKTLKIK